MVPALLLLLMVGGSMVVAQKAAPAQEKPESKPNETVARPQEPPAEKHTSPQDRQRLVAIARKLEAAPLDVTLNSDRAWAMQWVLAAPDLHVRTCTSLLADLRRPRYKYRSQIGDQLLISSAALLIEHPEKGDSMAVQSVGGMEGVLKAYSAILKSDPSATAKSLDELLQKQREGKLAEAVQERARDCR